MDEVSHPTTETRDPNISTEHQAEGDARRPSDTLDRGQSTEPADDDTEGGLKQANVDDRPNVSKVTPEDYPKDARARG